ncbi:hypothetical protein BDY17DRAFT_328284 [Neohortaea acidophila]|uniref:Uncharacterized protein n=1 Tax=Neohortaea acidophila TaxID=245834 RepID=A0A6A6PHL6_9PEZI|nr:uncharacterized protein BDY17DRAFT_328284 [Neohortaea acidophila]KAF2478767.1 hypothetical protein BDY17DRAFT_328284 [Neohortaea acidophila]
MKILAKTYINEAKDVQDLVAALPLLLDKERTTAKAEVESAKLQALQNQAPAPPRAPSAAVYSELRQAEAEIARLKEKKNGNDGQIGQLKARVTELSAEITAFKAQLAEKNEAAVVDSTASGATTTQGQPGNYKHTKKTRKAASDAMVAINEAQRPKSKKERKKAAQNDAANAKGKKGGKKGGKKRGKKGLANQTSGLDAQDNEVQEFADQGASVTAIGDNATSRDVIKTFNTDGSHIASKKAHGASSFADPLGANSAFRFGGLGKEPSYPRSKRPFDAGLGESGNTPKKIKTESTAAAGGQAPAATPKCRRCKKYALTCDSRSRCCHCEVADQRCIYEACPLGLWCKGKRCDEIHDGQWTHGDVPAWNIEKPRAPLDTLGPYHTSTAWVPQTTREASQTSSSAHETASTGNNLSPTA